MRLLLDAHLSWRGVGQRLQAVGHDVRALDREPEYDGLPDRAVLMLATEDERIVVTRNVSDFLTLAREWARRGRRHAGLVLIYAIDPAEFDLIARGVDRLLAMYPDPNSWTDLTLSVDRAFATAGSER